MTKALLRLYKAIKSLTDAISTVVEILSVQVCWCYTIELTGRARATATNLSWGGITGADWDEFEAALVAAGYTVRLADDGTSEPPTVVCGQTKVAGELVYVVGRQTFAVVPDEHPERCCCDPHDPLLYGKVCEIAEHLSGPGCETFGETVERPSDLSTGWTNQVITGTIPTDMVCVTVTAATGNTPQMIGLNSDPSTDASFQSIDYAFYVYQANNSQILQIRESGGFVLNVPGGWAIGDDLCIVRDPATGVVTYSVNGTVVHTSAVNSTDDLFVDSSFYFANGFWGTGSITMEVTTC